MKTISIPNYLSRSGKQVEFREFRESSNDVLAFVLMVAFCFVVGLIVVAIIH